MEIKIEICANTIQSAVNAKAGGADRVEICDNWEAGGTTPSLATIEYCINQLNLETNVLIRPRRGDFIYTEEEFDVICNDVIHCREAGANSVVVGFLTKDLTLDYEKAKKIVDISGQMKVVFHRAIDICVDRDKAIESLIEIGCDKILTSGGENTAYEGMQGIMDTRKKYGSQLGIIAASGINCGNVVEIIKNTGISEIHSPCNKTSHNNITSVEEVKKFIDLIKNIKYVNYGIQ